MKYKTIRERLASGEGTIDCLTVTDLTLSAAIKAQDFASQSLCKSESYEVFQELYRREFLRQIQETIIRLKNESPAVAAKLQAVIDEVNEPSAEK